MSKRFDSCMKFLDEAVGMTVPKTPEQELLCAVFGVETLEELDAELEEWHEGWGKRFSDNEDSDSA